MPRISNAARYRKVELFGRWTCRDSTDRVTPSGRVANASRTSHTRSTARNGYNAPSRDLGDVISGVPPAWSTAVDWRRYPEGSLAATIARLGRCATARICMGILDRTMGGSPIRSGRLVHTL